MEICSRPVRADLGQGLFQFQFEREEDLLSVLEKRPYHYAKWMVIVKRWEPITSPEFPSLIPFWIKVQGIPVHLWTEGTIKTIGEDIGIYEEAEITNLSVRMRVQVNGRLPLIKKTTLEYSNGDEVLATLVYEWLEKHCSECLKIDHEFRDCLEAKAQKKCTSYRCRNGWYRDTSSKAWEWCQKIRDISLLVFGTTRWKAQSNSDPRTTIWSWL